MRASGRPPRKQPNREPRVSWERRDKPPLLMDGSFFSATQAMPALRRHVCSLRYPCGRSVRDALFVLSLSQSIHLHSPIPPFRARIDPTRPLQAPNGLTGARTETSSGSPLIHQLSRARFLPIGGNILLRRVLSWRRVDPTHALRCGELDVVWLRRLQGCLAPPHPGAGTCTRDIVIHMYIVRTWTAERPLTLLY